jgi:hypothetical protein
MNARTHLNRTLALLFAVLCPAVTWGDLAAMPLPDLVAAASLIAKVHIGATNRTDNHFALRQIADVQILDAIVGCTKGDRIQLRYGRGSWPSVSFRKGEEFLLFAVKDVDGTYSTVGHENGKRSVDSADYTNLVAAIKQLVAGKEFAVSVQKSTGSANEGPSLVIEIVNKGKKDMTLFDWVDVDLRMGQELEVGVKPRGPGVKMVIVPRANYPLVGVGSAEIPNGKKGPPRITLKKDERCQGNFYFDQIPFYHKGRTKLRVWAVVGTQISDPVDVDLDLDALRNKRAASPKPWSLNLKKIETEDIQPAN